MVQIYDESGKPLASTQPKGQFRGRDEDRVDQRTFVMEVGADLRAGIKVPEELTTARRTILTSWINLSVKEKGKTPELDEETVQDIPVTNTKELMSWALKHGKEFTPTWVRQQVGAGNNVITNEQAQEYYQVIKDAMGWEN